jgi:hypothetical protein
MAELISANPSYTDWRVVSEPLGGVSGAAACTARLGDIKDLEKDHERRTSAVVGEREPG